MPLLSYYLEKRYGIKIYMYPEYNERHHSKHIHIYFDSGKDAIYNIESMEQITGDPLSNRQKAYVLRWIGKHQEELIEMFNSNEPYKID